MTQKTAATSITAPRDAGKQLALFRPLTILEWLPDETLYSLVARLHYLSGFRRESTTSNVLFGHPRAGLRHDFQHSVSEFERRTDGSLGSAEQILLSHTILPFFLCFSDREFSSDFIRSLADGYWDSSTLGRPFITGSTRGCNPLKACPACIKHDQETYGVAYWHRSHQFPGVWLCAVHDSLLMTVLASDSQSAKYKLRLPKMADLQGSSFETDSISMADGRRTFLRILRDSIHQATDDYSSLQVSSSSVVALFAIGAQEKGLTNSNGRLHIKRMGESYLDFISPIAGLTEFSEFLGHGDVTVSELARLLRGSPRRTHPLRYIFISLWLFGDFSTFRERLISRTTQHF
ncbi:TniQ family protein [Stenotrophobium rhamnosiphilum]|uniref:TniQ domain-containing protein n=1 Tax=Stenotrophobium rhamnosiphilum TaxID=2029166 RepID=A0A2T5MCJ7_9GAMM|nr:hypothetical protein CJD38_15230 [Stenotrophobium rhamnosiphilum]